MQSINNLLKKLIELRPMLERQKLLCLKISFTNSEQQTSTGAFSVTVSDSNVSIKMNQLDDNYFGLKGTDILTANIAGESLDKVKKALGSASLVNSFLMSQVKIQSESVLKLLQN